VNAGWLHLWIIIQHCDIIIILYRWVYSSQWLKAIKTAAMDIEQLTRQCPPSVLFDRVSLMLEGLGQQDSLNSCCFQSKPVNSAGETIKL